MVGLMLGTLRDFSDFRLFRYRSSTAAAPTPEGAGGSRDTVRVPDSNPKHLSEVGERFALEVRQAA